MHQRRTRAAKPARPRVAPSKSRPLERGRLSPERIQRAALALADREGLGGLTIRGLAAELNASPMGIYRYFDNKEAIVDGLVDLVVGDCDVTGHAESDLRDWLGETFRQMHEGLCRHPGITPLLGRGAQLGTNATRVMEEVLTRLLGAGLSRSSASLTFYVLMSYTIGATSFWRRERDRGDSRPVPGRRSGPARVPAGGEPEPASSVVVAPAAQAARYASDEEFDAGLHSILDALLP